jgi:general secretion pathway protein K
MMKKNSGVILLFVMVFTVAISTVVIFFHAKAKNYTDVFAGTQQSFVLENIAETGVEIAKAIIMADKKTSVVVEEESPALIKREYQFGDIRLFLFISDENSKINPNRIFGVEKGRGNTQIAEIFDRLFAVLGYPAAFPSSILDWIDEDDMQRPSGAESFFYRTEGFPYVPPNRNLYTAEEILLVRDFTKEIVFGDEEKEITGLINFITSFSDGKINVNTCGLEMLSALGFPAADAEKIAEERQRRPVEESFLTGVNKEVYLKNRGIIAFKSSYFMIESTAVNGGGIQKHVRCRIKKTDEEINTARMEIR